MGKFFSCMYSWCTVTTLAYITLLATPPPTHSLPQFSFVQTFSESEAVDTFTRQPDLTVLFYYQHGIKKMYPFFRTFNDSASHLKIYNVYFGMVDCPKDGVASLSLCQDPMAARNLYVYRNGRMVISMSRSNLFDVESIMSNILTVLLLKQIPIVATAAEVRLLEAKQEAKQRNLIISYHHAIGTYAHRSYMEAAYVSREKAKFALTTDAEAVQELPNYEEEDTTAIWVYRCEGANPTTPSSSSSTSTSSTSTSSTTSSTTTSTSSTDSDSNTVAGEGEVLPQEEEEDITLRALHKCPWYRYSGNYDLLSLLQFMQALDEKFIQDVGTDGDVDPYEKSELHIVYMIYDKASYDTLGDIAPHIIDSFYGILGVLLVSESHPMAKHSISEAGSSVPLMLVAPRGTEASVYHGTLKLTVDSVREMNNFIHRTLAPVMNRLEKERAKQYMWEGEKHGVLEQEGRGAVDLFWSVEQQDDDVALTLNSLPKLTNVTDPKRSKVTVLNDTTFYQFTQHQLSVVVFYIKYDAYSMAYLHVYNDTVTRMRTSGQFDRFGLVSCHDWTDVCANNSITRYPTVVIYRAGHLPHVYSRQLDSEALANTIRLFQTDSPAHLTTQDDIMAYIQGERYADQPNITPISVLAVLSSQSLPEYQQELDIFLELADEHVGQYLFAYTTSDIAHEALSDDSMLSPPFLYISKHKDTIQPHAIYSATFNATLLDDFIQRAAVPTFPELSIYNFPQIYREALPIVLVFLQGSLLDNQQTINTVSNIISLSRWKARFAWLNITLIDSIGYTVIQEYYSVHDVQNIVPAVSIVNHQQSCVYNYEKPATVLLAQHLAYWIEAVLSGYVTPQHWLAKKEWKPLNPGYDFLSIMDKEKEEANKKRTRCLDSKCKQEHKMSTLSHNEKTADSALDDTADQPYHHTADKRHDEL